MAQDEQTPSRNKRHRRNVTWKRALVIMLILAGIGIGATAGYVAAALRDIPDFDPQKLSKPATSSVFYNIKDQPIAKLHDEDYRFVVSSKDIPDHLKQALKASEDKNFDKHPGVDIFGLGRAVLTLGRAGGGSTITQQLAGNVFLDRSELTIRRKVQEAYLAFQLERKYTKDEILIFYLNQIFFGHWAKGAQAASQMYFGKDVKDITLAESAMLVGIIPAPNDYSPYEDMAKAKRMQEMVLDLMVEQGRISSAEADQAKKQEIKLAGLKEDQRTTAPYFVDFTISQVQELIKDHYGSLEAAQNAIFVDGLKVFTTLDPEIQSSAEKAITDLMAEYQTKDQNGNYLRQAATVVMDPVTGHIAAMVGGRGYDPDVSRAWNRATHTVRQPGSVIKPLVDYAPAIAKRVITAATVFDDVPTVFPGNWKPTDFDDKYYGLIGIREAIFRSQNITAIKTLQALGVDNGIEFLRKLGITTMVTSGARNDRNLSTAIGGITKGISVLELTQAYGAFANGGVRVQPVAIREIQDRYGRTIYKAQPTKTAVMDEQTAYIMTDLMKSVMNDPRGTGYRGKLDRPSAGKSGTTDDWADAWFVGYTPDFVSTVWIGHDQPTQMYDLYGKSLALRIWQQVMTTAHRDRPVRDWTRPANIVDLEICTVSGKRPSTICPKDKIAKEVFVKGTEPKTTDICDVHVQVRVDKATGLPATPLTPATQVETKVFIKRPQPLVNPLPYGNPPVDAKDELPVKFAEQSQPTTGNGGTSVPIQPTNPTDPSTNIPTTPTEPSTPPTKPGNSGNGNGSKPPTNPQ